MQAFDHFFILELLSYLQNGLQLMTTFILKNNLLLVLSVHLVPVKGSSRIINMKTFCLCIKLLYFLIDPKCDICA